MKLFGRTRAALCGLLVLLAQPGSAWACASCFGKSDSALAKGMNMGIFALLGFIGAVLAGIVSVAVYFALRSARVRRAAPSIQAERESESSLANV